MCAGIRLTDGKTLDDAPAVSRPPVRELEKVQNFWYNIYRKNEGREKLMDDFEMLSPAEQETAIRREYADAQKKINALVHRLMEEYRYFEYLRDQLAEIDALGADNVFGSSGIKEIKASLARNGYDF